MIDAKKLTKKVLVKMSLKQKQQKFESMMAQNPKFNGSDYSHPRDGVRLSGQISRVYKCMMDGKWRTLRQIAEVTGDPEASISAQLRHLRKERFGKNDVEKTYTKNGLYLYRIKPKE